MELLKVKVLLCFLTMRETDLTVTNLAVVLGEEKYAISRLFTSMEKEGLLDRTNKRKPVLTESGMRTANIYRHKVEGVLGHLLCASVSQEEAKADAIAMAVYCSDATFSKLRQQGIARRVKLSFHEGLHFDGARLCRSYQEGTEPLTFLIYQALGNEQEQLSKWNDRFENPGKLCIQNKQGQVSLHVLAGSQGYEFEYWDGENWRSMLRQGTVISFPAEYLKFTSIAKDEGRMLYGRIPLRVKNEKNMEKLLFTTYIA